MTEILALANYDVFVGNCTESLSIFMSRYSQRKVVVLTDEHTHTFCLERIRPLLPADVLEISIPAGEVHKDLNTCQFIWGKLLEFGLNRNDLMINLGGGVVGDMGGFCASTYKRGIDFIQIPTTLLSMVDASIGGKLGIDFNGVKNSIGVFKDPKAVFVDPFFLDTLPKRELRSGFAEIIKHALISDELLWRQISSINIHTEKNWTPIIVDSLKVKQKIVAEDPFEKNIRKALNFGHTIGHGIEGVMLHKENSLLHGEAIAIGMAIESWLSFHKGFLSEEEFISILIFLKRTFNLQPINEELIDDFILLMKNDKKNESDDLHFAVVGPIGKVHVDYVRDVPFVKKALEIYNHNLLQ
jgi:3-dehydroquinate synthase